MRNASSRRPAGRPKAGDMEAALSDLHGRVGGGQEYPDAEWAVASSHGVDSGHLREAYDMSCATKSPTVRPDMAFVLGVDSPVTQAVAALCADVGLRVHFAMMKGDPSKRVQSLADEAVFVPPLGNVSMVHVSGVAIPQRLVEDSAGAFDGGNLSADKGEAFAQPLVSFLYHARDGAEVPEDWHLVEEREDQPARGLPLGYFGPWGTVVADFGAGQRLYSLPERYSAAFPLLENKGALI